MEKSLRFQGLISVSRGRMGNIMPGERITCAKALS